MTLPRASCEGPIIPTRDGVRVAIRLSPRARSEGLFGVSPLAEGGLVVKASVTAPAQNGRANEALLQLLAKAWRLPRRDLSIVAGATRRSKTVRVAGDPQQLIAKLSGEIASLPSG
jgi:uncharacterized protein (TIGR00251 family)